MYGPGDNYNLQNSHFFPALINKITQAKIKNKKYIVLWGKGNAQRELMFVEDFADSLVFFMNKKIKEPFLNIGTGKGTSVLELINIFEEANNLIIPYEYVNKRNGDHGFLVADNRLSLKVLNWRPKRNIHQMCKDGWNFKKRSIESKISLESKNTFFI